MSDEEMLKQLKESIFSYDLEVVKNAAESAVNAGVDPIKAIEEGVSKGLKEVGEKFERGEIFLPQLVLAADAATAGIEVLKNAVPHGESVEAEKGTVVIGTIQGDIHSIGKDLVAAMLRVAGFKVYDLEVDVPIDKFLEEADKVNADIIAVSALMTFTQVIQKDLIEYMKAAGVRDKYGVLVGGAPVTAEWAKEIGADGYGEDAIAAVKCAERLMALRKSASK